MAQNKVSSFKDLVFNMDAHPFFSEKKRLKTFKAWPFGDSSSCNPKKMAEAGWFAVDCADANDVVKCMICDKSLDGWEESDDPWIEHSNHCPQCPFVLVNKKQGDWLVRDYFAFCREVALAKVTMEHDLQMIQLAQLFDEYERKKLGLRLPTNGPQEK